MATLSPPCLSSAHLSASQTRLLCPLLPLSPLGSHLCWACSEAQPWGVCLRCLAEGCFMCVSGSPTATRQGKGFEWDPGEGSQANPGQPHPIRQGDRADADSCRQVASCQHGRLVQADRTALGRAHPGDEGSVMDSDSFPGLSLSVSPHFCSDAFILHDRTGASPCLPPTPSKHACVPGLRPGPPRVLWLR